MDEVSQILRDLEGEDRTFQARATPMFSRPGYEVARDHELPKALGQALTRAGGALQITGASFWTDAAVLGHAGIPSILFGPGGAGLHSTVEYVNVADILSCRDTLVELALTYC
jgi:acetylornithine deacetylase